MKNVIMIGLTLAICIVCTLVLWLRGGQFHREDNSESELRQNLAGTWVCGFANLRCTNVISSDGSFVCQSTFAHPDRTNRWQQIGTWRVQDRHLTETVENDTNPTARTPRTRTGSILRSNPSEFVVTWERSTNGVVWQKVKP